MLDFIFMFHSSDLKVLTIPFSEEGYCNWPGVMVIDNKSGDVIIVTGPEAFITSPET